MDYQTVIEGMSKRVRTLWRRGSRHLNDARLEIAVDLEVFAYELARRPNSSTVQLDDYQLFTRFLREASFPCLDGDSALDDLSEDELMVALADWELKAAQSCCDDLTTETGEDTRLTEECLAHCLYVAAAALRHAETGAAQADVLSPR